jgi:hypothetical protein
MLIPTAKPTPTLAHHSARTQADLPVPTPVVEPIVIRTGPVIEPVRLSVQWFIGSTVMNRLNRRFNSIEPLD